MLKIKGIKNRFYIVSAIILLLLCMIFTCINEKIYAASMSKTITITYEKTITYGSGEGGYTNLKTTDLNDSLGKRPVLCMEPAVGAPPDGTYTISKVITDDAGTGKWNALRNIIYYTPDYPGYSLVKDTWFSGYTKDEAIAVMHMAVSYANAGRPENMATWGGTSTSTLPDRIWNKAKTITNQLWTDGTTKDENVPDGFKVLYVKIGTYQDMICGYLNNGKLKLTKKFLNEDLYKNNDCYSVEGIKFTVYDVDNDSIVGTFTTTADGKVTPTEIEIPEGTYKVVETHNKSGFAGNGDSKIVEVKAGETASVSFSDTPISDPIHIILKKIDKETGLEYPLNAGSLENAEYTVRYYDGQYKTASEAEKSGKPMRTWKFKTDDKGIVLIDVPKYKISGDELFYTKSGKVTLPLGTVLIQETKAPIGYLLDKEVYVRNIVDRDNETIEDINVFKEPISPEQIKRGDLEFKKSSEGKERMAGIPFKITSKTTKESHIVITDENGFVSTASSWNLHSSNTNQGKNATDGVWFGKDSKGNTATVDDNLGALPYDVYTIKEQECEANKNYELVNVEATISRDNVVVDLGTIDNPMKNPKIKTKATGKDGKTNLIKAEKKQVIIDTVSFWNLNKGEEYKLLTWLVNSKGKRIKGTVVKTKFIAKSTNGKVKVKIVFDATKYAGKTVTVFEELYLDNKLIATHKNKDDTNQMIKVEKRKEKTDKPPETGDKSKLLIYGIILLFSVIGVIVIKIINKIKKRKDK